MRSWIFNIILFLGLPALSYWSRLSRVNGDVKRGVVEAMEADKKREQVRRFFLANFCLGFIALGFIVVKRHQGFMEGIKDLIKFISTGVYQFDEMSGEGVWTLASYIFIMMGASGIIAMTTTLLPALRKGRLGLLELLIRKSGDKLAPFIADTPWPKLLLRVFWGVTKEELIFRVLPFAVILPYWSGTRAVLVVTIGSTLVFAAFHIMNQEKGTRSWKDALPRIPGGIVLAYVYLTAGLLPAILFHYVFDLAVLIPAKVAGIDPRDKLARIRLIYQELQEDRQHAQRVRGRIKKLKEES